MTTAQRQERRMATVFDQVGEMFGRAAARYQDVTLELFSDHMEGASIFHGPRCPHCMERLTDWQVSEVTGA